MGQPASALAADCKVRAGSGGYEQPVTPTCALRTHVHASVPVPCLRCACTIRVVYTKHSHARPGRWADEHGLLFVASVGPGYNDTKIRPWVRARRAWRGDVML
jgi:hypothetical protein